MVTKTHYKIANIVISKPTHAILGVKHGLDILEQSGAFTSVWAGEYDRPDWRGP